MSLPFLALLGLVLAPRFESPAAAIAAIALTLPATTVFGQGLSLVAARTSGPLHRLLSASRAASQARGGARVDGADHGARLRTGLVSEGSASARGDRAGPRWQRRVGAPRVRPAARGRRAPRGGRRAPRSARRDRAARTLGESSPRPPCRRRCRGSARSPLLVLLFEAVARLPVDFREAPLRTSLDPSGGSRAFGGARERGGVPGRAHAAARPVPWLMGRGPAGAIVWLRMARLLRQARGSLVVAGSSPSGESSSGRGSSTTASRRRQRSRCWRWCISPAACGSTCERI